MRFKSILIVSYGRSGSTLLQGILNSIDGCLIRGENDFFCLGLYNAYKSILKAKTFGGKTESTNPWFGANLLDKNVFLSNISNMIKELLLGDKLKSDDILCYGFKEIRYYRVINEFAQYLDFMANILPKVAFIFNTRKLDDVVMSGWWKNEKRENVINSLSQLENAFLEYHKIHDNTFQITYEDITQKTSKLLNMFDFLGVRYSEKKVDEVLAIPHSS